MHCKKFFATLGFGLLLGVPAWAMPNDSSPQGMSHSAEPHFTAHFPGRGHDDALLPDGHFRTVPVGGLVNPVLPMGIHHIDVPRRHDGHWRYANHGGRTGWRLIVGSQFYWYWCDAYQQYYPYVTACPSGWRPVLPGGPIQ